MNFKCIDDFQGDEYMGEFDWETGWFEKKKYDKGGFISIEFLWAMVE